MIKNGHTAQKIQPERVAKATEQQGTVARV